MCKASLCLCARRFLERKLGKELCGKLRFPSVPVREIFCGSDILRRSHFFVWRVPPCGARREACSFQRWKEPKIAGGTAPMSAYAERALIVTFPPVPLLRERVPLDIW